MKLLKLLFIGILTISFVTANSQVCKDFKWKKCEGYGTPFKYSGQSKGAFFEKGHTSNFYITAYGGFEYCVTLCAEKKFKGIYFRILKDDVTRKVLYDSSTDPMNFMQKQFYTENTEKLIIEVTAPEGEDPEAESYEDRTGCIGVLIEYVKSPKRGF